MSPARRREAVAHVRRRLGVSERRACRVLRQPRTTQRYVPRQADDEHVLTERIVDLARVESADVVYEEFPVVVVDAVGGVGNA